MDQEDRDRAANYSRRQSVLLALQQAVGSLRRAARDLPPDRAQAILTPVEAELSRCRRELGQE